MAIDPTIDILGLDSLRYLISKFGIKLKLHEGLLENIAQYAIFRIKKRTSAGEDVDGRDFIPYSDKYSLIRQEYGRPTNKVDLFFTGSMMGAITSDISDEQVVLYFMNTSDSSNTRNPLKAFFLNESRHFFALSEEDIKRIEDIVNKFVKNSLR